MALLCYSIIAMASAGCASAATSYAPQPGSTAAAAATENPIVGQLKEIDQLLETIQGNLAFNAPSAMNLEDTTTIHLLISPTLTKEELAKEINAAENQAVITSAVNITPRMKAELKSADPEAFNIQPLHDSPEQLLSTGEPTEWKWLVQAKKEGKQDMTLSVYRLVEFEGKEYWREKSYEKNIEVKVTLIGLIRRFDWKWLVGLAVTGIAVPLFIRWLDQRKKPQKD
ncbi:MAG TPA: hypothetical protein VMT46_04975 [Anaerolineaceae bacterium]|nr:hypothetical protein [Anaerolineaceae bacterium]